LSWIRRHRKVSIIAGLGGASIRTDVDLRQKYINIRYIIKIKMSEKWGLRFTLAAIFHGVFAAVWSGLFIVDQFGIQLNMAKIVAGGSVGTWLTLGYLLYLIAGVMGNMAFGSIYGLISRNQHGHLFSNKLALTHFILFNVGVIGVTWPMGYVGFLGGSLLLAGKTAEIHPKIVGFVLPIGISVAIGVLSTLIGATNIILSLMRTIKEKDT
jgi:hypothetical protein